MTSSPDDARRGALPPPPPPMPPPPPSSSMVPPPALAPVVPAPVPRPAVPLAAALMLVGAVVVVIGSALNWLTLPEGIEQFGIPRRWNGFTEVEGEPKDGVAFTVIAVIIAAFAVTTLTAKRLLPIMILGVVLAGFGLLAAAIDLADVADADEFGPFEPDVGPGLPVVIAGFAAALGGFVVGLARRRR